jgi:phage gp46-like protein
MPDIAIVWDTVNYRGDWDVTAGDLAIDPGGLRSAVLLSLFTDARAPDSYVAPAGSPTDRRGYWGDTYDPPNIGSLLWTLDRSKKTGDMALLSQAQDFCQNALQWLITAGVVGSVTTSASWIGSAAIGLQITLTQPQSPPQTFNFEYAWQGA